MLSVRSSISALHLIHRLLLWFHSRKMPAVWAAALLQKLDNPGGFYNSGTQNIHLLVRNNAFLWGVKTTLSDRWKDEGRRESGRVLKQHEASSELSVVGAENQGAGFYVVCCTPAGSCSAWHLLLLFWLLAESEQEEEELQPVDSLHVSKWDVPRCSGWDKREWF